MSNRAVDAYGDGKLPLSKISRAVLAKHGIDLTVKQFRFAVKEEYILPSEWHHTSKRFNRTDFYDLAAVAEDIEAGDLDLAELKALPAAKAAKAREYVAWVRAVDARLKEEEKRKEAARQPVRSQADAVLDAAKKRPAAKGRKSKTTGMKAGRAVVPKIKVVTR